MAESFVKVRVKPEKLEEYRAAASTEGVEFSEWVRQRLDGITAQESVVGCDTAGIAAAFASGCEKIRETFAELVTAIPGPFDAVAEVCVEPPDVGESDCRSAPSTRVPKKSRPASPLSTDKSPAEVAASVNASLGASSIHVGFVQNSAGDSIEIGKRIYTGVTSRWQGRTVYEVEDSAGKKTVTFIPPE